METIQKLLEELFKDSQKNGSVKITVVSVADACKGVPFDPALPVYKIDVLSVTDPEATRFVSYVGMHEDGKVGIWATTFLRKQNAETILSGLPGFEELQGNGTYFAEFDLNRPKIAFKKVLNQIGEVQTSNLRGQKLKLMRVQYNNS
jgi:hypothetical protein